MPNDHLVDQLVALPLLERVELARALWQSIDEEVRPAASDEEREAVEQAARRDAELSSGAAVGRTHEEVMQATHLALGCD